jgi:replicative DNA helicase
MALAAHFASQGFPKEVTYRILKGAVELQMRRYPNQEEAPKDHLWNSIIKSVYSDQWQGKTYACKDHQFLQEVCPAKGTGECKAHSNDAIIAFKDLSTKFKDFAKNIDKNRVYTGIEELDKSIMLTTSMPVGILGSPGSGKTSMLLNILENTSKAGIHSMFCSLDMGWPLVYAKLISRHTGLNFETVLNAYKTGDASFKEWDNEIGNSFKNVGLTFKSGTTVDDIRQQVIEYQEKVGEKVKLIAIDYLEMLHSNYSDPTANAAYQAAKLKDLATDLETCVMVLVQPPKSAGDPSKPLTSYRQVKGASALEQNFRAIISVHREGFSPDHPGDDKFITINGLKNTMGPLFSLDMKWDGVRGMITPLSFGDQQHLKALREAKEDEAKGRKDDFDF